MTDTGTVDEGFDLVSSRIVMYSDLNAAGRLFGGRMLSWIDEATAMAAMRIMNTQRLVTKKFGEVVFDAPGMLGDVVEIRCRQGREGRTSLTLEGQVLVRQVETDAARQICSCTVVYVAIDDTGKPMPWKRD